MSKKIKVVAIVLIAVLTLSTLGYGLFPGKETSPPKSSLVKVQTYDPPFTKEGELELIDGESGNVIQKISIEVVDNNKDIQQGLMYRSSMLDTLGMLFVFERPDHHSFWMKNTKIPLDIIFIDADSKIVNIAKNTTPYSETSIPSEGPVLYVLEVNAGFSDRRGLKLNDMVRFTRFDKPVM